MGLVALFVPAGAQESGAEEGEDREQEQEEDSDWGLGLYERARSLIQTLEETDDPEQRRKTRRELLDIGRPAIPLLEDQIREKGARTYYQLIRKIQHYSSAAPDRDLTTPSAPSSASNSGEGETSGQEEETEMQTALSDQQLNQLQSLLSERFQDAQNQFNRGNYEAALKIAEGIRAVSPRVSFEVDLRNFIVRCKEQVMEEQLVRPEIEVEASSFEYGEKPRIDFSLTNVSDDPVRIYFGPMPTFIEGDEENPGLPDDLIESEGGSVRTSEQSGTGAPLVAELEWTDWNIVGNAEMNNRILKFDMPEWIHLAPGATWRTTHKLDTTREPDRVVLREYRISAETRPSLIAGADRQMSRWLQFDEKNLEVYPRGIEEISPPTMHKIRSHLNAGNMADVFFLSLLMGEEAEDPLLRYLVRILPNLKERPRQTVMFILRRRTGENRNYRVEEWVQWGQEEFGIESNIEPEQEDSRSLEEHFEEQQQDE